jgi:hypothetical protein
MLDAAPPRAYIGNRTFKGGQTRRKAVDMRFLRILLAGLALWPAVGADTVFATDWQRAGETRVEPLYPYKNLPGVKAQADKKDEEQYSCRTETRLLRRRFDEIFRSGGMPTLVYVCDRDGVITSGAKVPLRGHYQPVR